MIRKAYQSVLLALLLTPVMLATGCEKKEEATHAPAVEAPVEAPTPAPGPATADTKQAAADAAATAKSFFAQRCTLCHGMDGKGNGPASATLNPKPRDYSDPKWQAGVTDELLAKTIVEGGAAVGKSMMMPPNADLKDKPEVVAELVRIIRGFKK